MRYTIYKVTNLDTGKFYIGKHQTNNPNDGYYGSGVAIKAALREHGRSRFIKEVLFDFDTEEEMNAKERELVNQELVENRLSYNMALGGEGGPHFRGRKHTVEAKAKFNRTGQKASEETRAKISEANRQRSRNTDTNAKISAKRKGFVVSEETKAKIAASLRARNGGKPMSEEVRAKISATMKKRRLVAGGGIEPPTSSL